MIRLEKVSKNYSDKQSKRLVLRELDWEFSQKKLYALTGRSGAGKSTLLNILGGLDKDYAGEIFFDDLQLRTLNAKDLASYRRAQVGFVFQDFHLLDKLSVLDNVLLSTRFLPKSTQQMLQQRGLDCLGKVGLQGRDRDRPGRLSGGERQRVALARALLHQPKLILADEPTGNLDQQTAASILDLLKALTREREVTVIMATHDVTATQRADQILNLQEGKLHKKEQP